MLRSSSCTFSIPWCSTCISAFRFFCSCSAMRSSNSGLEQIHKHHSTPMCHTGRVKHTPLTIPPPNSVTKFRPLSFRFSRISFSSRRSSSWRSISFFPSSLWFHERVIPILSRGKDKMVQGQGTPRRRSRSRSKGKSHFVTHELMCPFKTKIASHIRKK